MSQMLLKILHMVHASHISATEEINARDLQTYLSELVLSGVLPFGTTFYMIGGIHHGITQDKEAYEGRTDFTLLHGFYHQLYSLLIQLEIWDKMSYRVFHLKFSDFKWL